MHHYSLYLYFLRLPPLIRIFSTAFAIIFIFGSIIHFIEPDNFPTIFEGFWWAIVTVSTIGYGDYVPATTLGKMLGIVLILLGVGFISTYFVGLASAAISKQNQFFEGKLAFRGDNHIVIIGWNERSRAMIKKVMENYPEVSILLIDETLEESPLSEKRIHFIQGRPTLDSVLHKANLPSAKKVLITADQHKDEYQADMCSILTLIAIKGISPNTICQVEILTTDQVENAKRAGADMIIQTNQIVSKYMLEQILKYHSN